MRHRSLALTRRAAASLSGCALVAGLAFVGPASATAQDGTGAATPTPPSACSVPLSDIDLANPPTAETAPIGTPAAIFEATPVTTGDATPVAIEASPVSDAASPADPLTDELLAAATIIAGCRNERDVETYTRITSDAYRGAQFGLDGPLDAAAYGELAGTLPNVDHRIVSLDDVMILDERSASAVVTYVEAYQQRTGMWTFVQEEIDGLQAWVLDAEEPLDPVVPDGTEDVTVEIADNRYALSSETIASPNVAFALANADEVDHEALVLRFAGDTTTADLLQNPGPTLPQGVEYIGQATVPAGGESTLVLADLPPGTYTIVCLLPDAEGLPHLASGMTAEFTVR